MAVRRGIAIGLALALAQACSEPIEPPVPPINASHVCCPAGVSTPLYADGRWTAVEVAPIGGEHPRDFYITMTHPVERAFGAGAGGLAGTFPGGTLVQFVVQGCDPAVPGFCFTARQTRLAFDDAAGWTRFGAELTDGSDPEEFDDFIYEVRMTPVPPPPDTLVVEVLLARDSVGPVLAQLFNAVTQVAESTIPNRHRAERTDTVRVRVRARFVPSGLPGAGTSVRLIAGPVALSGGHAHHFNARPTGTFFAPGEDVDVPEGGLRGQVRVTLPASGDTVFMYRTSGVSGRERLVAAVTASVPVRSEADSVVIRWAGLEAMAREGTHHEFKDQDPDVPAQRHGSTNHWVEPGFRDRALDAFRRYFEAVPEPRFPLPAPGGGFDTRFVITDVSLESGGLFDIDDTPWHNPHKTHRKGVDMDVRSITLNGGQRDLFILACERAGVRCIPETDPVHFHLR